MIISDWMSFFLYIGNFNKLMRHSKSLKIINRSMATLSHTNIVNKNYKGKNFAAKNRTKVKRNSTGNMETYIQQKYLHKIRQKVYKEKDNIFASIQISKCEPIPQIETPTLIDENDIHRSKKIRQLRLPQNKNMKNDIETKPLTLISLAQIIKKSPSLPNPLLVKNNDNTVKRNNQNQSNNKRQTNRTKCQKISERFTQNLTNYLHTLKRTQTVQILSNVRQSRKNKEIYIETIENRKQRQLCKLISEKIKKYEQMINKLIAQHYYQQNMLEKDQKKHQQMENYIYMLHLHIKALKQGIKKQRKHRKRLYNRLNQYGQHFLKNKHKQNEKIPTTFAKYHKQQQEQMQILQNQPKIYIPSRFSDKKARQVQYYRTNLTKNRFSTKKILEMFNFRYNSDISDDQ